MLPEEGVYGRILEQALPEGVVGIVLDAVLFPLVSLIIFLVLLTNGIYSLIYPAAIPDGYEICLSEFLFVPVNSSCTSYAPWMYLS